MKVDASWFGPRLKELREAAGLTQQELADLADLTRPGVANLEQARTSPYWETVVALCRALKVNCDVFMQKPAGGEAPGPGRPRKKNPKK